MTSAEPRPAVNRLRYRRENGCSVALTVISIGSPKDDGIVTKRFIYYPDKTQVMEYDRETVESIFEEEGEVMFVLESDREYELHSGNVTFKDSYMNGTGIKDGELLDVCIPYHRIEHHFTHRAL